jgi:hypothetical protein
VSLCLCGKPKWERQENIAFLRLRVGFAFFAKNLLPEKLLLKKNHQQYAKDIGRIGNIENRAEKDDRPFNLIHAFNKGKTHFDCLN